MSDTLPGKIIFHLRKGQLRGKIFDKLFRYLIPELIGRISLLFYRWLYANLFLGQGITCSGAILLSKTPESVIRIGNNVRLISNYSRTLSNTKCKIRAFFGSRITIGDNVGLNGASVTCRTTSIEIGDGTIIASNVIIVDSDFHGSWPPENRTHNMGFENDRAVKIGKNVWIGMNVLILKGVSIGDNSVIAAGSVVARDIPSDVIAGGVPARVLKPLHCE